MSPGSPAPPTPLDQVLPRRTLHSSFRSLSWQMPVASQVSFPAASGFWSALRNCVLPPKPVLRLLSLSPSLLPLAICCRSRPQNRSVTMRR